MNDREIIQREELEGMFPSEHIERIIQMYSKKQIVFIRKRLKNFQLNAIKNPSDYLPAAIIERMNPERWKWYEDRFMIRNQEHYRRSQLTWLADRKWYLSQQINEDAGKGNAFANDVIETNFGLRNRALYIFKYMGRRTKVGYRMP